MMIEYIIYKVLEDSIEITKSYYHTKDTFRKFEFVGCYIPISELQNYGLAEISEYMTANLTAVNDLADFDKTNIESNIRHLDFSDVTSDIPEGEYYSVLT